MGLDVALIPLTSELRVLISIPTDFKYTEGEHDQKVQLEKVIDGGASGGDKIANGGDGGNFVDNAKGVTTKGDMEDTCGHDHAI